MAKKKTKEPVNKSGVRIEQIPLVVAITKHIDKTHGPMMVIPRQLNVIIEAANEIVAAFAEGYKPATPGMGLAAWATCDDTGVSSLCMYRRLHGRPKWEPATPQPHEADEYPRDADDFGRCVRLLDAEPRLREYLHEMAECGPVWGGLVAAWDDLESLYRAGDMGRLTARMALIIG